MAGGKPIIDTDSRPERVRTAHHVGVDGSQVFRSKYGR
jgi:hypothetical protein